MDNNSQVRPDDPDGEKAFSKADWEICLLYWNYECAICGRPAANGIKLSRDHWIPQSKGGLTTLDNILPLCHGRGGCNNQKCDSDPVEWIVHKLGQEEGERKLQEIAIYFQRMRQKGPAPVIRKPRSLKASTATRRIPMTPSTFYKLRDFRRGLNASYDETLEFLMSLVSEIDGDLVVAGKKMRAGCGLSRQDRGYGENPAE